MQDLHCRTREEIAENKEVSFPRENGSWLTADTNRSISCIYPIPDLFNSNDTFFNSFFFHQSKISKKTLESQ
jgi:hypothetical protein